MLTQCPNYILVYNPDTKLISDGDSLCNCTHTSSKQPDMGLRQALGSLPKAKAKQQILA